MQDNEGLFSKIIKKEKVSLNEIPFKVIPTFYEEPSIKIETSESTEIQNETENESEIDQQVYIESLLKNEYQRAFEEGKKNANTLLENEYKNKTSKTVQEFINLINNLKEEFLEYQKNVDIEVVKLSISIAMKILKKEILIDNQIVLSQIKDSIRKIMGIDNIIIHINPDDIESFKSCKSDILNTFESIKEILIQSNEKIDRGSCRIESNLGNVDARLSTQLQIIENALLDNITQNFENVHENFTKS